MVDIFFVFLFLYMCFGGAGVIAPVDLVVGLEWDIVSYIPQGDLCHFVQNMDYLSHC